MNVSRFNPIHLLLSFIALFASTHLLAASIIDATIAPMVEKVSPTVVNIRAQIKITDFNTLREIIKRRGGNLDNLDVSKIPKTFASVGSGVIVDAKNGYILTNSHVVADAQIVIVTGSDGRHYTAKLIGLDRPSDVAVLQIKASNLSAATIGDSNKLKVGDFVAAVGNPFGLGQTVTSGIISALGRTQMGIENYENFIQTDASINPGNSGGALINMQGELIGINTAILAPDRGSIGIGFAIPANMAKSVMQQLIEYGDVKRGILGIGAQDITPELAAAFKLSTQSGAAVTQVFPNTPAQLAGMKVGDIITNINGSEVKTANDVVSIVGFLRVDSKITVNVLRANKPTSLSIVLSDPKNTQATAEKNNPFMYGVGLQNFSLLSPIHGNVSGVVVLAVEEDSNAWRADLRPGDVIVSANQERIANIEQLHAVASKSTQSLLLNVLRGPSAVFLVVSTEP